MTPKPILLSIAEKNLNAALNTNFESVLVPLPELELVFRNNNFSPIQWKDGIRNKNNFQSASAFVVDSDDGLTIEEAEKILQGEGINYILITSQNHTPENNRFHILVPFNRKVLTLKNYEAIASNIVNNLFPSSDPSVTDGARFIFGSPDDATFKIWLEGGNYNVD